MGWFYCTFVTASLLLTAAFLAVGISFFCPYWLSNIQPSYYRELNKTTNNRPYIDFSDPSDNISFYPDRGLWAQCGARCYWFWTNDYQLQEELLTPLKWHLATQILYFIAATMVLFSEIYARVQMCCHPRRTVFISLGIIILVSALIQVAAVAVFGGGASRDPYNAISDPKKFTKYLGQVNVTLDKTYLGWGYWMAVVGAMLSVASGVLFIVTSLCKSKDFD